MGMNSSQYFDIELIRARLQEFKRQDPGFEAFGVSSHRYELNAPLARGSLEDWEQRNKVQFPDDFRDFLLFVGDGGPGPGYGLDRFHHRNSPEEVGYIHGSMLEIGTAGCSFSYGLMMDGLFCGTIWQDDTVHIVEPDIFSWAPILKDRSSFQYSIPNQIEYNSYLSTQMESHNILGFRDWYIGWIMEWSPLEEIKRSQEIRAQAEQRTAQNQSEKIIKTQPNPYAARLLPWLKKKT
jgi:hypothetical protein